MKVEVWYAVDEDGGQYLFTSKPKRYQEILIIRRYLKKIEYN